MSDCPYSVLTSKEVECPNCGGKVKLETRTSCESPAGKCRKCKRVVYELVSWATGELVLSSSGPKYRTIDLAIPDAPEPVEYYISKLQRVPRGDFRRASRFSAVRKWLLQCLGRGE